MLGRMAFSQLCLETWLRIESWERESLHFVTITRTRASVAGNFDGLAYDRTVGRSAITLLGRNTLPLQGETIQPIPFCVAGAPVFRDG